jgi:hypothetical protein
MRQGIVAVVCLVAFLATSGAVFAQRTTGSIIGRVTDDSGAVLPGVTVALKSDAIVGTQSSVSNEQGLYRFPALPPGSYNLAFSLAGFTTLNRQGLKVSVGGTLEENVSLKVGGMAEELTVEGESPVVDTTSNQVSTNYDKDWVRNAPLRRFTFFDLINSAPGVTPDTSTSSRSTSLGSNATDNSYQLDGTDFTAPLTGAAWPWPNTDAIEEIEVLSLGAPAEYGNLQGAVFNVVTRQGGNTFHGDVNAYLQTQGLTSSNTSEEQDGGQPYNRDKFNDVTAQIQGPVLRDKLWFFASYQYQRDYESQAGTPAEFPARSDADRVFFKLNYQITAKHKLMFAYHDDFYRIPGRATAFTAPSTITVENGHNPSPNLTYTGVLSDKTYIEARYSGFYGKDHGDPLESGEPRVKPRFSDFDTGEITGGIYSWYDGTSDKTAFAFKLSHFADSFLGASHDFKFGVQYNSGGSDYVTGPNDYIYTYSGVPAYGYTQLPWHEGGHMNALGFYADDTVRLSDRFNLNLGLRFDTSKGSFKSFPVLDKQGNPTGQNSPAVDELFTWNSVSPRIGFNWKVTGDGRTVLKAHYGRYYRGIVTGEFDNVVPSVTPRFIFDGTYDAAGNPNGTELVSDNTNLRIDSGFKNPYTDQFIVSFERELFKNVGVQASYVYKRGEDYGGWTDVGGTYVQVPYVDNQGQDASGQTFTVSKLTNDPADRIFLLTNPGGMFSRFSGLTLQVMKRMSDNWQLTTSLVVSKSTGRIGSSQGSPTANQNGTAGVFGQNPNDFLNSDGRLIADRPVVFKTQLVYQLPAGFLIGANFTFEKGRPWARQVRVPGLGVSTVILAEQVGERRVADWTLLDLRLQKEFKLGQSANFAVFMDALNLLNDDANESVGNRIGTTANFGEPTRFLLPRRLMVGAKFRF